MSKTLTSQDDAVFVFTLPTDLNLHSAHAFFMMTIEEGKTVAYDEFNEILCYGNDSFKYTLFEFLKLTRHMEYTEMKYFEYLREHQERLAKMYPDAPIIAVVEESSKPRNPIMDKLTGLGLNVKITR